MSDLTTEVDGRVAALQNYAQARHIYESMRDQTSEAKKAYDEAQQTLIDVLTASGASDTGKIAGVGRAILKSPALKVQVLAGDRVRLADWVREIGQGDVIYPTLLPSALTEIVETRLKENLPIPEFLKTFYEPRISFERGI